MKRSIQLLLAVAAALVLFEVAVTALAQESRLGGSTTTTGSVKKTPVHYPSAPGTVFIPKSSMPQTPPTGHKFAANTNVRILIPAGVEPDALPPFPGYGFETPQSLACEYGLTAASPGGACNPETSLPTPTGGSNTIAIVDAYDDPEAPGDLAWFSLQFGLPLSLSQFEVVQALDNKNSPFCPGSVFTDFSGGWELEESLDIEWAHAMAPNAKIYLVEACTNFDQDLQQAVLVASNLVQCGQTEINPSTGALGTCPAGSNGKGEISMSWGGGEFLGENLSDKCTNFDDSCFVTPGIVYIASTGDSPGVAYPSSSPNVVAAGGTTNRRNAVTFNFIQEAAWDEGGGGQSAIEKQPAYQAKAAVQAVCGTVWRCVPDLAFDANLNTGVYVYDSFPMDGLYLGSWWIVGGTSVASPSLAGIINRAGAFAASSTAELTTIYGNLGVAADFTPVGAGFCGPYGSFSTNVPYNLCTGVGTPNSYKGK
jgi:subtilase family serine protease